MNRKDIILKSGNQPEGGRAGIMFRSSPGAKSQEELFLLQYGPAGQSVRTTLPELIGAIVDHVGSGAFIEALTKVISSEPDAWQQEEGRAQALLQLAQQMQPVDRRPLSALPKPKHILIVDDDEMVREFYNEVMMDSGVGFTDILEAANPVEARDLIEKNGGPTGFGLIITDHNMPGYQKGTEFLVDMAQLGIKNFIHSSGSSGPDFIEEVTVCIDKLSKLGCRSFFLPKPVSPRELIEAVRTLLEGESGRDD